MLTLDARYKIVAVALAFGLHFSVALMLAWNPAWENVGAAKAIGQGGIEIALASVAAKPAAVQKQPKPKPLEKKDAAKVLKDKPKVEPVEEAEEIEAERLPESESQAGGGIPLTEKNYMSTLQVWLERHKKYPYQARRRQMEGTALLYFEVDKNGNVLEYYIKTSSGYALLDKEVMNMIKRAQPMPAMPDDMNKEKLTLVLPVQFFLR